MLFKYSLLSIFSSLIYKVKGQFELLFFLLYCDLITFFFPGKLCIEVSPTDKIAFISEELCIGCGICSKVNACIIEMSCLIQYNRA